MRHHFCLPATFCDIRHMPYPPCAPCCLCSQLSTEVPRLLARDITFACLPRVLYYIHNERQDLLPNLVSRLSLGEGMFKGGPPTAATAQKRWVGEGEGHGQGGFPCGKV